MIEKDLSKVVEFLSKKLGERIKKGDLTVRDYPETDPCIIRYTAKDVRPSFNYKCWASRNDVMQIESSEELGMNYVNYCISEMAGEMEDKGINPYEYLEV